MRATTRYVRVGVAAALNVPAEPTSCLERNCLKDGLADCSDGCIFFMENAVAQRLEERIPEKRKPPLLLFLMPAEQASKAD
ncbi:MAG: hypothetical protein UY97_C0003G0048 [Parcubacteria group bacterium GW2011_GWB1_57_6]|nr:MAG: hypothetical protein UY93_C0002G0174 [Parcubacteria group bacterium GW2011_GWA1_56_13]KKW46774.1 MAG: hypothetical protein UY97_C0003G0048 [Parcubacteria group bacterium GW2011_GWB1_57_6]